MSNLAIVATCSLNQWALDFKGNLERIERSLDQALERGASLRTGPELEITGYGCNDHFLEQDTYLHSWQVLAKLLRHPACTSNEMICDFGMPVHRSGVNYNCRVIVYKSQIVLIRPKMTMADSGNYRESRWFTAWSQQRTCLEYQLPLFIRELTGQVRVPFGDAILATLDTLIGIEICEEVFTAKPPHIDLALDGCEVFLNGSASHHELRKLNTRLDLILTATRKVGGVYLYANQIGCDGERLFYDGSSLIAVNGDLVNLAPQFSLDQVCVVTATINLDEVRSFRSGKASSAVQAAKAPQYPRIYIDFSLTKPVTQNRTKKYPEFKHVSQILDQGTHLCVPEQEIALGPSCWLWDYLRRSNTQGYFLALSGGIDSCATAVLVYVMCQQVYKAIQSNEHHVLRDLRRITGESLWTPKSASDICHRILHTCYMQSDHSSEETRDRATKLACALNSYHVNLCIDTITTAIVNVFTLVTGHKPLFKAFGGSSAQNLALQNIQARTRMILSYLFAQLLCWVRGRDGGLLVLGSTNVDESLRGYLTKYDCSSADLNPIGGISKRDLQRFIQWAQVQCDIPVLGEFLTATPTAELEPITNEYVQNDEVDMGMSYTELSVYGRLRKVNKLGPYSMYMYLLRNPPQDGFPNRDLKTKIQQFWYYYALNRHKSTVLTPSYHAEVYGTDDNRFDLRPFLYPVRFEFQFEQMMENENGGGQ